MTLNSDLQIKDKLTFCLKNDVRNFVNFNLNSEKSENFHFDGMFFVKSMQRCCEKRLMVSKVA